MLTTFKSAHGYSQLMFSQLLLSQYLQQYLGQAVYIGQTARSHLI